MNAGELWERPPDLAAGAGCQVTSSELHDELFSILMGDVTRSLQFHRLQQNPGSSWRMVGRKASCGQRPLEAEFNLFCDLSTEATKE